MPVSHGSLDRRARHRIGAVLRGKYTLERVLGVGGMAAVYLGVHRNGYRVAVKMLHAELSFDDAHRARFVREGYVANAIDHRGAVRVLDDDITEDGAAFLVMELLEGETLHERRKRRGGRLPHREALALGHQLLDVLAVAHNKGIIHRDIKPENLFLTTEGILKVLDFGIARFHDETEGSATLTGRSIGTPAFMPPEQALGRKSEIDARTDVWACGATLFTLLSGQFVHVAETAEELVVRTATLDARPLSAVAEDVPREIALVVDRALAYSKAERWPTARAMQEALEQAYLALTGEPIASFVVRGDPAALSAKRGDGEETREEVAFDRTEPARESEEEAAQAKRRDDLRFLSTKVVGSEPLPAKERTPARPRARPALAGLFIALCIAIGAIVAKQRPRAPGTIEGAAPRPLPACTKSAECVAANQGKPFVCKRDAGVCAPLESELCKVIADEGDLANDATLWVGVMFPTTGPDAPLWGQASVNAVDLARRDFKEVSSGLSPARPGGPPRPLGLVVCDDAKNPERAADHLVNNVGVPAIVGFARSREVLDLATSLFIPRGVLALASNTASMLTSIPHVAGDPRLVFRTTTSATMSIEPDVAIVSQVIEPELRKTPGLVKPDEPIRVALARINNASGLSFADLYVSTLRYNGKSVVENGDNFRMIVVPDDASAPDPTKDLRVAAAEIAAFRPHVLLMAGPNAALIPEVERAWPERERFRPRYVSATIINPVLFQLIKERPEVRRRILSVDTASGTEVIAKFVMRYNQVFTPKVTPQTGTFAPYDAAYLLAYAVVALGEEPVTGKGLARAIARMLPPGEPVDVGPAGIYPAFHALSSGKNIDLKGTTTSLDFNLETGDATADFAVFCIAPGGHGDARDTVPSGLVYDARSRSFQGVMRCP